MRKVYGFLPSLTKLLTSILFLSLSVSVAYAETRISGYVYDLSGNPLIRVSA